MVHYKANYEKTIESLKKTHGKGKASKKRLPFENVWPVQDNKESKTGHDCLASAVETMDVDSGEHEATKV